MELDIMEENLAKLISQHQSMPQLCHDQPADPFRKGLFGKKMRKSKHQPSQQDHQPHHNFPICHSVNSSKNISEEKQQATTRGGHSQGKLQRERHPGFIQNDSDFLQKDTYQVQMQVLFGNLRTGLTEIEREYQEKTKIMRKQLPEEEFAQRMEEMVGHLEGSVDFILHQCLRTQVGQGSRGANKENIRSNHGNGGKVKVKSATKRRQERAEKSIYEAVLEERELRRARRRML